MRAHIKTACVERTRQKIVVPGVDSIMDRPPHAESTRMQRQTVDVAALTAARDTALAKPGLRGIPQESGLWRGYTSDKIERTEGGRPGTRGENASGGGNEDTDDEPLQTGARTARRVIAGDGGHGDVAVGTYGSGVAETEVETRAYGGRRSPTPSEVNMPWMCMGISLAVLVVAVLAVLWARRSR